MGQSMNSGINTQTVLVHEKDKGAEDLRLVECRPSSWRIKRKHEFPDRVKVQRRKFSNGMGIRTKFFTLWIIEMGNSVRKKLLIFSMRLPVFKYKRHLRKKFSFNEGRSPDFGSICQYFFWNLYKKHEVGKKKETIKKSGSMGFIEFPRPLEQSNEVKEC